MSSALLGGSTAILASPLATTPVALLPVIATTVSTDQSLSLGPLGNGTVSVRESASSGGYTVSLVDSAGAGATVPLWTATSAGGPPITSATVTASAPISHASASQCGTTQIALGQSLSTAVALPAITASSIVMVTQVQNAPDATALSFSVVLNAGVGFSIRSNANATAATTLGWFVAKY
jgi:hypothetical protein